MKHKISKGEIIVLVDYHVHALGHADREHTLDNLKEFIEVALKRNVKEIGFADHDRYLKDLDFTLYQELQKLYPQINIRVGLEIDYFPGKLEEITKIRTSYPFDYVIGSVHYVGDWMFDADRFKERFKEWDIDELYAKYLSIVLEGAQTGLFPLIGHLDLLKIFGYRPTKDLRATFWPYLQGLKKTGVVLELNTNGWYKPVNELYPSPELIELCFEADLPITLSSDAHQADQVGRDVDKALAIAKKAGYTKIATFGHKTVNFINV
ncbi:MAG: histidinol-phosphatase HisJ family protein [Peptococcales bacterium]|jgi:histidinol-phosphatase (PHP family)